MYKAENLFTSINGLEDHIKHWNIVRVNIIKKYEYLCSESIIPI